ncbi:hypothetical protein [Alicyclobacillus mali (ex Roth et al. 2021)]|uniref:hypothetical protein n=1 Tax=Alicyclobacillus mali (ex Roth et al. 2021) TaxID=1123961 RepID=UPI0023F4E98A|nr:hypothetical protein [Alicyclobacillus mali (ex Roth et al. 2021)]
MATKIAFLCQRDEIVTWLTNESHSFAYEAVNDVNTADACVVLAADEEEAAWAVARIPEGKPVLWFGVLPETNTLNLVYHDPELTDDTLEDMLIQAQVYHERLEANKPKQASRPALRRPSLRRPSEATSEEEVQNETTAMEETDAEQGPPSTGAFRAKLCRAHGEARDEEPRGGEATSKRADIAVGGVTAAWFAWQLAALTDRPLFSVIETNDFAAWHAPHAKWQGESGVVYTGRVPNAIWREARVRIWVTTLDPAHVAEIPAELTHLVVNRVPDGFPVEPEVAIGRKVNLVIPERPRSVLRMLYQGQPWILHQPQAVLDAWSGFISSLAPSVATEQSSKEEDSEWTISW